MNSPTQSALRIAMTQPVTMFGLLLVGQCGEEECQGTGLPGFLSSPQ